MKFPLRAMFDTNVYEVLYREDLSRLFELIKSRKLLVYGCKVIRDELREIPKSARVNGKSYRGLLLSIYDDLTKNHVYPVESVVEVLAGEYWRAYKGGVPKRKLWPDFLIVAVASIHGLDIIVSEDNRTMKSMPAARAYGKANKKNGLETPRFISLKEVVRL